MINIIAGLLVGGFATAILLWDQGPLVAILLAPIGASLLAVVVAVGHLLLGYPVSTSRRRKKELREFDRQRN